MGRCMIRWLAGAVALVAPVVQAQQPAPSDAGTVSAVWVEREVNFTYMGYTTHYSCDGLRDKVGWILRELGARRGFTVKARNCFEVNGPERIPGVRIVAALPAEATPERLGQLAEQAAKQELATRVKGGAAAGSSEGTAQFPARRKRVEFRSTSTGYLQDGDCELFEQLRDRVFPELGVEVVEQRLHCVPRDVSLGAVRLTVEVLEPVAER